MIRFEIEKTHDGNYRVVEFSRNGFLVLGTYDDREVAEGRRDAWLREWISSN